VICQHRREHGSSTLQEILSDCAIVLEVILRGDDAAEVRLYPTALLKPLLTRSVALRT
jgi:hypothetical protein